MAKVLTTDNISSMLSAIRDYIDEQCERLANGCSVSLSGNGATLSASSVAYLKPAVIGLILEEGVGLSSITVTMGETDITSSAWDSDTNSIIISKVTDPVAVTVVTTSLLSTTLDGVTLSNRSLSVGQSWSTNVVADTGKQVVPSNVVVTMEGTDITSTAYDWSTNTISITNVTGTINVIASAAVIDAAYKPVLCIQYEGTASGKQFLTGYAPTNLTEVIADVNVLTLTNYSGVFGTNTANTPYFALMARYTGSYGRGWWGNKALESSAFGAYLKIATRQTITMGKGSLTYLPNGSSEYRTVTFDSTVTTPWTAASDIQFGGFRSGSSTFRGISIKIYEFQIKEDNTLVRRYIPCYRISDNVIGLYDIVNDSFLLQSDGGSDWTIPT